MKRTRTMELTGKLERNEEKMIIENDLAGVGWKLESFKIIGNDFFEAQDNTFVARLATTPVIPNNTCQFERNDVLAVSTYGGGANQQILDMTSLITDELYITNCTQTTTISDKTICYQIILGYYEITDFEQVVSQVKLSQG